MVIAPKKIAVIEDDRPICEMYELKLKNSGYDVKIAFNGIEGLELVKDFEPALVLLDLKMPIMSGDEMLKEMRQHDWGSSVRVVILTNISKDEAPHVLRFLNVDRYVVKAHHTPAQILDIIKEVIGAP